VAALTDFLIPSLQAGEDDRNVDEKRDFHRFRDNSDFARSNRNLFNPVCLGRENKITFRQPADFGCPDLETHFTIGQFTIGQMNIRMNPAFKPVPSS